MRIARRVSTPQRVLLAIAVIAGVAITSVVAQPATAGNTLQPAQLDVTGWSRQAAPAAVVSPSAADGIGPGSYLLIERTNGQTYICTANFVWARGGDRYLGAAGHCFLPSDVAVPSGSHGQYVTKVEVCVSLCAFGGQLGSVINGTFVDLGEVVYARQSAGGNDVGNDFGLVKIPSAQHARIRTKVPVWGGPTGAASTPTLGRPVCLYGNAGGLGEVFPTKARAGVAGVPSADGSAWFATMPSFQGDSGAGVVNCPGIGGGSAAGVLTHLATNGTGVIAGTTISRAKAMATEVGLAINILQ